MPATGTLPIAHIIGVLLYRLVGTNMTTRILVDVAASITELKANPMKVATSAYGEPVAVLN